MSFVLVAAPSRKRWMVQRPDVQPIQYQKSFLQKSRDIVSKLSRDNGMRRMGRKHFCEDTCYVPPKKAQQGSLFDEETTNKVNPQAWV